MCSVPSTEDLICTRQLPASPGPFVSMVSPTKMESIGSAGVVDVAPCSIARLTSSMGNWSLGTYRCGEKQEPRLELAFVRLGTKDIEARKFALACVSSRQSSENTMGSPAAPVPCGQPRRLSSSRGWSLVKEAVSVKRELYVYPLSHVIGVDGGRGGCAACKVEVGQHTVVALRRERGLRHNVREGCGCEACAVVDKHVVCLCGMSPSRLTTERRFSRRLMKSISMSSLKRDQGTARVDDGHVATVHRDR